MSQDSIHSNHSNNNNISISTTNINNNYNNISNASPTTTPACSKCIQPLGDQLVRALDGAFHPECFTCWVKN